MPTPTPTPTPTPIAESFATHANRDPDAPALVWRDSETSYGELYRMALRHQDAIDRLDLEPAEPVGVLAAKSPPAVALVLGCLLAGRGFLLPSAALPHQTLRTLFDAAGCRYVLSPDAVRNRGALGGPRAEVAPGTGFMLTTSGSTGRPKIVPLGAAGVHRFVSWAAGRFGIGPGRTVLSYAPLNFDLCLLEVWTTLACGGRVVLCDPAHAASGRRLAGLLTRHEIHLVQAVPLYYRLLIEAAGGHRFGRVRHVIVTGEAIPTLDLRKLPQLFPSARLYNVYGCTETNDSFLHELDPARLPDGPVPLGRPLPGVRALVLTGDGTVLRGPGTGELYVSTPFQTDGYLGEWASADRFGPHPVRPDGRRYYRTGDLVVLGADHQLRLRGRNDLEVKVAGVRIDLPDVERVLLEHPAVAEAAVVTGPAETGGSALLAVLRRVPGSDLNSLVLRGHCARSLAPSAIPSAIRITDHPLPRTSTGKVDRHRIADQSRPSEQEPLCDRNGPSSNSSSTSSCPMSGPAPWTPTTTSSRAG